MGYWQRTDIFRSGGCQPGLVLQNVCFSFLARWLIFGAMASNFYEVRMSTPFLTHNLEGEGMSLCLAPWSKAVWHVWPY
jgi:hypothetical protein